jgi:Right handed beta helix region
VKGLLAVGLIAGLVAPATASAADFYVDQETGSESNDCSTPALACQTIQRGVTLATNAGVDQIVRVDDSPVPYVTSSVTLFSGVSLIADNSVAGTATESPTGKPIVQTNSASGQALFVQGGVGSPGTTIRGFTFRTNDRVGIVASGPFTSVEGNDFEGPGTPTASDDDEGIVLAATSPTVSGNTFTNLRFGAIQTGPGSPNLSGNEFSGNHHGNSIEIELGSPTLIANLIHDSGASTSQAIRLGNSGSTSAVSATFRRNRILAGGSTLGVNVSETAGPISFDGDLIAGAASVGIAMADGDGNGDADVSATNVTVVSAPSATSEISISGAAQLTLDSSVVGDNSISAVASASCLISFTRGPLALVTANGCHTFQTRADPLFVDADAGDFHLQQTSTMVDAGNPGAPPGGTLDLDGEARALDGNCDGTARRDIGADELVKSCPPPPPETGSGTGTAPGTPTTPKRKKCKQAKKRAVSSKKKCKKRK